MKRFFLNIPAISLIAVSLFMASGCLKTENPVKYPTGTFPDTILNLADLNTVYDDYNLGIYNLSANIPLVFSSNRRSHGGQFDLVQGILSYAFDQTNGNFWLGADTINDPFLTKLLGKVNTAGNDYGPTRLYSSTDGYEYLILASENANSDLDLYYTRNLPVFGNAVPDVEGPFPVTLLNSSSNEAYITFSSGLDSAYYSSDASGTYDIYLHKRPDGTSLNTWFNLSFEASTAVDSLNSPSDDKCPYLYGNVMVFASNRPGGQGGYDLYYSVLRNGKWSTPVNFGAPINTASDEFRPVMGGQADFTNVFMMFSSNRPGGLGGFDLYFTGIPLPE